jgi:hypothetical protein
LWPCYRPRNKGWGRVQQDEEPGDIIPEEIARKRGMKYEKNSRGHIFEAHVPSPFLIDKLHERNVLNASQHHAAAQLIALRSVFLTPIAAKTIVFFIPPDDEAAPDVSVPIDDADYLKVLRRMRHENDRLIVIEICAETLDADAFLARIARLRNPKLPGYDFKRLDDFLTPLRNAFDALGRAQAAYWKQKRERAEQAAEIKNQCRMYESACARPEDVAMYETAK